MNIVSLGLRLSDTVERFSSFCPASLQVELSFTLANQSDFTKSIIVYNYFKSLRQDSA